MAAKANLGWAKAMKESPIFILAFETLTWILEHTRKWPKDPRFVLARRIEEAAFDFQDHLVYAAKATGPLPYLQQADAHLTRLRLYRSGQVIGAREEMNESMYQIHPNQMGYHEPLDPLLPSSNEAP